MALPTPLTNNNKVDLDTEPTVAAINKVLAPEFNALTDTVNALISEVGAAEFVGFAAGQSPAVAPAGEGRIKVGAAGLEASFSGGAYAPLGGGGGDTVSITEFGTSPADGGATNVGGAITLQPCDATHPGMVSEADQVLGAGRKTMPGAVLLTSDPTAPVSAVGGVTIRNGSGVFEISQNGSAYLSLVGSLITDPPQVVTSSSGHLTISFGSGQNFYHLTTQATTLDAPTGAVHGMSGVIEFKQGSTPRALTFDTTFWKFSGGVVPGLTLTGSARDLFVYYINYGGTTATCRMIGNVL